MGLLVVPVTNFRDKRPDTPGLSAFPSMSVLPAFGTLASDFLTLQLHGETWLTIGPIIYFASGRKHSLINPNSPRHDEHVVLPTAQT